MHKQFNNDCYKNNSRNRENNQAYLKILTPNG
jgi:hypothetical protein